MLKTGHQLLCYIFYSIHPFKEIKTIDNVQQADVQVYRSKGGQCQKNGQTNGAYLETEQIFSLPSGLKTGTNMIGSENCVCNIGYLKCQV